MSKNCFTVFLLFSVLIARGQRVLTVQADEKKFEISPTMWGVFFEDINFAADGGLYAEMIKNRSFEFPTPMMGWHEVRSSYQKGRYVVVNRSDGSANEKYLDIIINRADGDYKIINDGFRGIAVRKNEKCAFSILAQSIKGDIKLKLNVLNARGQIIAEAKVPAFQKEWQSYKTSFITSDTTQNGRFQLTFEGSGEINIDMVSLFPYDTWKGRPGGLRKDIVEKIAALKPGFIRFPGGCIVEGKDLANRYQWKNTVGNTVDRRLIMNRWNKEFTNRPAPDYYQSFGLGFFEYFLLAEDLGAAPLPILNCGMACQFNSGEVVALGELDPYIQDALDLIEFANGDISTKWGSLRNQMGHPVKFNLQYLGIGNEQWEPQYIERYAIFEKTLLTKYPYLKIVSGAGPYPQGDYFDYAWKELRKLNPSLIDEHYYKPPAWFFENVNRYDNYPRKGPKVFAGEYAAHSKEGAVPESRNNWESALAEAAFMTGLERNADIVRMCSYAPLLAHVDAWQWRPDLIWFDNLKTMTTPNYLVQKMYSTNRGTHTLSITEDGKNISGQNGLFSSAVADTIEKTIIIKIVNNSSKTQILSVQLKGSPETSGEMQWQTIASDDLSAFNQLNELDKIIVHTSFKKIVKNICDWSVPAYSFTIGKIATK